MLYSGVATDLYPAYLFFGVIYTEDGNAEEIPQRLPFKGKWGRMTSYHLKDNDNGALPVFIDMVYMSVVEKVFYSFAKELNPELIRKVISEKNIKSEVSLVVGMAPYGGVAIWLYSDDKTCLLEWAKADEAEVTDEDISMYGQPITIDELRDGFINNDEKVKSNLKNNGLPPKDLFTGYMKQFTYRYQQFFGHWDEEEEKWKEMEVDDDDGVGYELDYIEEMLYDGTFDKVHDGQLMKYHEGGKPCKVGVKWHKGKTVYEAYLWFDEEGIRTLFGKFYGAHPDTKTDVIIRMDPEGRKYEVALYRYGLAEARVIPEEVYGVLVFKNDFEDYRRKVEC